MSALGWDDLGNVVPIRGFDKEALKREVPLDYVLYRAGVELMPDTSGSRLVGMCPFGQHTTPKFAVWETEAGERVCGCWACPDKAHADLFGLLQWLAGPDSTFAGAVQTAGVLKENLLADEAWKNRPPVILAPVPKTDPAVFTADAEVALQTAYGDPSLIEILIERKRATDPGWNRLTAQFLMAQWRLGAEPEARLTQGVNNPDAMPYDRTVTVRPGTRVIVPHYALSDAGDAWLVRGIKTRDARHGHLFAAAGSDLSRSLYGAWRSRGLDWVLLCEGESDAWCASAVPEIAERMDVLALPTGVKANPHPEQVALLRGKNVVLAFDGDLDGQRGMGRWVTALEGVAASVSVAQLPPGEDLSSTADILTVVREMYLVGQQADGADDDVPQATEGPGRFFGGKDGLQVVTLAEGVLESGPLASGMDGLIWTYEHGVWSPSKNEVRDRVVRLLGNRYRMSHSATAEHVIRERTPTITGDPVPQYINFRNGLYDWRAHVLYDHAPIVPSTVQLGTDIIPGSVCPNFDAFLASVLPPDMIGTAWELIGYLMYSGNPLHKAVMLIGEGRNGKGTFLRAVTALIGEQNTTATSLKDLADNRFSPARLLGKLANIAGDIDGSYMENTATFKAITGEDVISAERKGLDGFDFKAWAVPVFSANRIPPSADVTSGYLSRWLVLKFPFSFLGHEDRGLTARITTPDELAGIAWRGVHALRDLLDRGQFPITVSGEEARHEFVRGVDQIHTWADECAVLDPALPHISRTVLYDDYKRWAMASGFKAVKSSEFYSRLESSEMPQVQSVKSVGVRGFVGIALSGAGAGAPGWNTYI